MTSLGCAVHCAAMPLLLSTGMLSSHSWIANPIFEANRCSINFHPLHSYIAIVCYVLLLLPKQTRLIALGLCIHILADTADCLLMQL